MRMQRGKWKRKVFFSPQHLVTSGASYSATPMPSQQGDVGAWHHANAFTAGCCW